MTDLVPDHEKVFEHGKPAFAYTELYRCFPGKKNGLLFRLVNNKKQWAFYNDTPDLSFHVTALLGADSNIRSLGRTKITEVSSCGQWGFRATALVAPGRTERFLEGTVEGFQLDFSSEAVPADCVTFENGSPTMEYDAIYKCLKNHGNGLLFRLVSDNAADGTCMWSYYNDTKEFTMEVEVVFSDKTSVEPLGATRVEECPGKANAVVYKISVAPLQTEKFLRGNPREYSQSFVANPLENEEPVCQEEIRFENGEPNRDKIAFPCTRVFKGFKNNGNGLIFLLVDESSKKWAFYNDTVDYNITATVRFGPGSTFKAGPKTKLSADSDVVGGTICVITVPPVTTELFIFGGNPANYQLLFSAESIKRCQPECRPKYENKGPDKAVMPHWDMVYRCFKDHGNGLLFRLVDEKLQKWAFYNDTTNTTFTVKVAFEKGASVRSLGNTKLEEDDDLGTVHVLCVPPLATEMFAEGEVSAFTTKFSGRRCQPT